MADVQKYFRQFHDDIKLIDNKENKILREKRENVLEKLNEGLKKQFPDKGSRPSYIPFNQGSYAMHTGIKAFKEEENDKDRDFDIDIGLRFLVSKDNHEPHEVKGWVYKALENHTKKVEVKKPCVRVTYFKKDKEIYHVDLAVYSHEECNDDGENYLAKGHLKGKSENRSWEESHPVEFINKVKNHLKKEEDEESKEDREQFRRSIRYLKRWKDKNFRPTGHAAPISIGFTISAYNDFEPSKNYDSISNRNKYDDLESLIHLVKEMLDQFQSAYNSEKGRYFKRLKVFFPFEPGNDVYEKMSDEQMEEFQTKLEKLHNALKEAREETDPVEACKILRELFGESFPIPPKINTGTAKGAAVISSGRSA